MSWIWRHVRALAARLVAATRAAATAPPRDYQLVRWLILRLLGLVYAFAFLGIVVQGLPLLGSHGLTPIADLSRDASFWKLPSVFVWGASDDAIVFWAYLGLALAVPCVLGYANAISLVALWLIYGSFERVGGLWWSFGWEIQLLETTLIAAFLAHPWDPRPLAARAPSLVPIVLMRWLVFRIMLGSGLIKLRGHGCWTDLTCLDWHFETQPIPNPLSAWFHHMPHWFHAAGVAFNHVVELGAPWLVFGPRRARIVAGIAMLSFQLSLIVSGNLSFLNWLTIVPILACFDDDAVLAIVPGRARRWLRERLGAPAPRPGGDRSIAIAFVAVIALVAAWTCAPLAARIAMIVAVGVLAPLPSRARARFVNAIVAGARQLRWRHAAVGCFAALVAYKSVVVIENLAQKDGHQKMNASFDRFAIVNTYGAFGTVGDTRHELVIEGTLAADPTAPDADWRAYELPCKPGDPTRRPCVLGPYHLRLDWLIWFSAMEERPGELWIFHLAWKLLDGDRTIRRLIAVDPFDGAPPRWVRIRRFVYRLAPVSADAWWTREEEDPAWLPPVALDSADLRQVFDRYGWPSPSDRGDN